jgi:hypothetical protein
MKKIHVFPEAIPRDDLRDGPWTIRNTQHGSVTLSEKVMAVPLVDMPCGCGVIHSRGMRLHEYGHVAFSPADHAQRIRAASLDPNIANGVEDARLKVRLEAAMGEPLVAPSCAGAVSPVLNQFLSTGKFAELMAAYAGAWGSDGTKQAAIEWRDAIEAHDPGLRGISQVMESAATVLDELQALPDPVYQDTINTTAKLMYFAQAMQAVMDAIRAEAEKAEQADETSEEEFVCEDEGMPPPKQGQGWEKMRIERVPLDHPSRAYPSRKWTSREEGVIPSAMHRYATDGRIFKQPAHRAEPLTVLVDCSGSMRWNWEDLRTLLDKAPATTVALYSGSGGDGGVLRIVAENGKKCDSRHVARPSGAGNMCDGYALRWLAKHKGKKLWVSDGHVTGADENHHPDILKDTVNVVTRGKIMRVDHHQSAMDVVTGKKSFRPTKGWQAVSESHRERMRERGEL